MASNNSYKTTSRSVQAECLFLCGHHLQHLPSFHRHRALLPITNPELQALFPYHTITSWYLGLSSKQACLILFKNELCPLWWHKRNTRAPYSQKRRSSTATISPSNLSWETTFLRHQYKPRLYPLWHFPYPLQVLSVRDILLPPPKLYFPLPTYSK